MNDYSLLALLNNSHGKTSDEIVLAKPWRRKNRSSTNPNPIRTFITNEPAFQCTPPQSNRSVANFWNFWLWRNSGFLAKVDRQWGSENGNRDQLLFREVWTKGFNSQISETSFLPKVKIENNKALLPFVVCLDDKTILKILTYILSISYIKSKKQPYWVA